jgi:hypothetical protein
MAEAYGKMEYIADKVRVARDMGLQMRARSPPPKGDQTKAFRRVCLGRRD